MEAEYFEPALFFVQITRCRTISSVHLHWPNFRPELLIWLLRLRNENLITFIQEHRDRYHNFLNQSTNLSRDGMNNGNYIVPEENA